MYTLAAADAEKAHSWIKKLQEKREQWIHREAAQGQSDLDRQAKRKVLQPLHKRPGVLLPSEGLICHIGECNVGFWKMTESEVQSSEQASTVRKIVSQHMKLKIW